MIYPKISPIKSESFPPFKFSSRFVIYIFLSATSSPNSAPVVPVGCMQPFNWTCFSTGGIPYLGIHQTPNSDIVPVLVLIFLSPMQASFSLRSMMDQILSGDGHVTSKIPTNTYTSPTHALNGEPGPRAWGQLVVIFVFSPNRSIPNQWCLVIQGRLVRGDYILIRTLLWDQQSPTLDPNRKGGGGGFTNRKPNKQTDRIRYPKERQTQCRWAWHASLVSLDADIWLTDCLTDRRIFGPRGNLKSKSIRTQLPSCQSSEPRNLPQGNVRNRYFHSLPKLLTS